MKAIIIINNLASKINIENGNVNSKLEHIQIKFHIDRDYIEKKFVKLLYIDTNNMLADILTKNSNGNKITNFANKVFIK